MSVTLKVQLLRAVMRLLEPLARLLLDAGVGVGEFNELAKRAYVRAARNLGGELPATVSQIAVLTGINRGQVASILARADADDGVADPERGVQRAERVLRGWWTDLDFRDSSGEPSILPLRGTRRSFAALVKRYAGDPRVLTVLNELLRVKAVRRLPDQRLEVLSRTFATARWDGDHVAQIGERIRDLLETLVHNLKHPSRARYVRFVVNPDVNPVYVPLLIRNLTEQAENLADGFEDAINDRGRTIRPQRETQDAHRLGVGIFVFEEPTLVEPVAKLAPPTASRAGRKKR